MNLSKNSTEGEVVVSESSRLEKVVSKIEELSKEYYTGMEVSYLEDLVRDKEIASNKIYNYMSKGYIQYKLIEGKKRIHKDEVVKYLSKVVEIKSSEVKEEFGGLF